MKPSEKHAILRAIIETRKPQTASDSELKDYETVIMELYDEIIQLEAEVEATNAALEINDNCISGVEDALEKCEAELERLREMYEKNEWRELAEALGGE